MQMKAFLVDYFYALQNKAPNNYKILTLALLGTLLSVTIIEGVITPVRWVSGSLSFAILFLLGAAAQP